VPEWISAYHRAAAFPKGGFDPGLQSWCVVVLTGLIVTRRGMWKARHKPWKAETQRCVSSNLANARTAFKNLSEKERLK